MEDLFVSMFGAETGPTLWQVFRTLLLMIPFIAALFVSFAYFTLAERRVLGAMHVRIGPNRVGPWGLIQPWADAVKLMVKEIIIPAGANKILFLLAPILSVTMAIAAWAVVPLSPEMVFANIDASLLYILAITSMGVYGVILAGWSSNSKYAFLGAMRSAAQIVAYEIAMGFALVCVLIMSQSLNLVQIVEAQKGAGIFGWFWIPLFPMFIVYFISAVAETNRAPFDVAEGESEIVAGFHVEYSGMAFSVFFIAEYINMILVGMLTALMFLGGWLSPFPESWGMLGVSGLHWLLLKVGFVLFFYLWFRATFPRYRYDQIMRLGWKVFIPITIVWLVVVALLTMEPFRSMPVLSIWFGK